MTTTNRALPALLLLLAHCGGNDTSSADAGADRSSVELLAVAGNTPTVRLEQDESSGFPAQIWDIGGNEQSLFVRDRTSGSVPVQVEPNAPTSSLYIDEAGNVGVGTAEPTSSLNVRGSDGETQLLVEDDSETEGSRTLLSLSNNGPVVVRMVNRALAASWSSRVNVVGSYTIALDGTGVAELEIAQDGTLTVQGAIITNGPSCNAGCDTVFSPAYQVESIAEHAQSMWSKMHLPGVGPTPEGSPIDLSQKTTGILNELEKAHIYIAELDKRLAAKEARIDSLERRLERLEAMVSKRE